MNNIELKWEKDESDIIKIVADKIDSVIEINVLNKEIKNLKTFFREILFKSFINNIDTQIVLSSSDIEIKEAKLLIDELITLCNAEMKNLDSIK